MAVKNPKKSMLVGKTTPVLKNGDTNVKKEKNTKRKISPETNEASPKKVIKTEGSPKQKLGDKKEKVKKAKQIENEEPVDDKKKVKKIKTENGKVAKKPVGNNKKKAQLAEKIKGKKEQIKFAGKKEKTEGSGEEKKPLTKIEMRNQQKKLKEERRKKKDGTVFELSVQAKKVWEELRREDCPKDRQTQLLSELYELVKGKVKTIVHAHDTSRVIECLVSLADEKIRDALYEELKDDLISLMKSRYASFFVMKLVKHGNKEQRAKVFKVVEGQVARLARHKVANAVLELCYNEHSNGVQRNHFLQEFFGAEFQHFKDDEAKNVLDVLKKHPEKTKSVMINLMENSNILITKGCYNISLVHTVLYNYMLALNNQTGEQNEKNKTEFISSLRDVCVHLIHSHDGARLTMQALWQGTAKDRKSIIKSLKGHVTKVATDEQGHLALLALFDCVDDTKLVGKAIIGEMVPILEEVIKTKQGRDVIVYLMNPRNTVWFYPGTLDVLKQGDGNVNSKKDREIRSKELYELAAPHILKYLAEHLIELIHEGGTSIIMVQEILRTSSKCAGNKSITDIFQSIFSMLAEEVAKPFVSGDDDNNIIENSASHRMLRKLITQDKENNKVEGSVLFSTCLVNILDAESIESYLGCNRGCFVLVNLLETEIEEVRQKLVELLKPMANRMRRKTMKGAEILKKKLDELLPKEF